VPSGEGLSDVLLTVRAGIDSLFGEQKTKAGLIAPLLRVLGWDVEDFRQVHLEAPVDADAQLTTQGLGPLDVLELRRSPVPTKPR
jgi:hypothetical protein